MATQLRSRRNESIRGIREIERKRSKVRVRRAGLAFGVCLVGLNLAVVGCQLQSPAKYEPFVSDSVKLVAIPAVRGTVTDRNGVALAITQESRHIFADPALISDPAGTAVKLAPILGVPVAELTEKMSRDGRFVYLGKNYETRVWQQIQLLELSGIGSERADKRAYPEGGIGANIIGYLDSEGVGVAGIESQFEELLAGIDGEKSVAGSLTLSSGDYTVSPAVNGSHVQLTIDRDIQYQAQLAISAKVKEARAESGTVIVLNPRTGEILAMATAPSFDPNNRATAKIENMGNRAVSDVYEPGSTGKVMTVAAVIDAGVLGPDSKFTVPNRLKRADYPFSDHKDHPTLKLTLTGVLAKSSNIGTILAAEEISSEKLFNYFKAFGVGSLSGVGLPTETTGVLDAPDEWNGTEKFTVTFGQGYSVNSLQVASIFGIIANDGLRMPARIVHSTTDAAGVVTDMALGEPTRVISAETARVVREMMESVVSDEGTAPMAQIPGYRVAGKTGTAQYAEPSCGCYRGFVASFVGFAPADKPELVVAVNLVKPKNGRYGGTLAGPVFKDVMSFALNKMGVAPTGTKSPKHKLTW